MPLPSPVLRVLALLSFALAAAGCRTPAPAEAGVIPARAASATAASTPRARIDGFLQLYLHDYGSALPDDAVRARLAPMLTPAFNAALAGAAEAERCAFARHQGAEPPLIQGDVFSSLFEKANAVRGMRESANDGSRATWALDFAYEDPASGAAPFNWQDDVLLVRVGNDWLIDDFVHRGEWEFSSRGSVRTGLEAVARACTTP